MDIMVKMKNIPLAVLVLGSLSLRGMELQIDKKSDLSDVLLFAQTMRDRDVIIHDIAATIVHNSCLLFRMDTIYKKFDQFFHFNNEKYTKKCSVERHRLSRAMMRGELNQADFQKFLKLTTQIDSCRKFDALEPHHLLFLTEKQDEILLSLIMPSKAFYSYSGSVLVLDDEENEQYLMLPAELRAILDQYIKPMALSNDDDNDDL